MLIELQGELNIHQVQAYFVAIQLGNAVLDATRGGRLVADHPIDVFCSFNSDDPLAYLAGNFQIFARNRSAWPAVRQARKLFPFCPAAVVQRK